MLGFQGWGQSFTLTSGYYDVNASPVNYNCGRVIFNYNTGNTSTSTVNFEVFSIDAFNNSNSLGSSDGLPKNFASTQTYSAPTYVGIVKFYAIFNIYIFSIQTLFNPFLYIEFKNGVAFCDFPR